MNDTAPPSIHVLGASDGQLRVRVLDRGSAVDPSSLSAEVDGHFRRVAYNQATGLARVAVGALGRGRHRLVLTASDFQETKNNENAASVLPNTRRLATTFSAR